MPPPIPYRPSAITPTSRSASLSDALANGRVRRDLARLHGETVLRIAAVQATGIVQTEKVREVNGLAREALSGHAMLTRYREVLAAGDPLLADELRFFTDVARAGVAEVIADTVDEYCRESRGLR